MKNFICSLMLSLVCGQFVIGCKKKVPSQIVMQSIPVASIPIGAEVYSNGRLIGQTPINVSLEKTNNHIITIAKPGFVPQNITIIQRHDDAKLYTRALVRGIDDGLWGFSTVKESIEEDEKTGCCYTLEPQVVSVQLIPEGK